jgi:type IV conjugative transfer system protein TraL
MQRMPQFLHKPTKFVGLEDQEFAVVFLAYVFSLFFQGYSFFYFLTAAALFIPFKRSKPRGYIGHLVYRAGFARLQGYPVAVAETFHE